MAKSAVDSQLEICEDEDVQVRLAAIRGLARLAESLQDTADVERVLDAVLQLLLTVEDNDEEVALTHVLTLLANARIEALVTCCLALLPQQVDASRTKLFAILTSLFDAAKQKATYEQVKVHASSIASLLQAFLVANANAIEDAEFKTLYALYTQVYPLNARTAETAVPKYLEIINARSGLDQPLTAETLPAAAKGVHLLSRVLGVKAGGASVSLLSLYRTVFAAVPLAVTPEATTALSTLFAFLVSAVKHLDARQCNTLFPAFLTAVKSVLPAESAPTYPYTLVSRMFELFHALANPLKDSLRDLTGLDLPSIQPSSVSADTRAQRLADLQQRVAAFTAVADALTEQMTAEAKEGRARKAAYHKVKRAEVAAAKAAEKAAAAAAMVDAAPAEGEAAAEAAVEGEAEAAPAAEAEAEADAEAEDGEVADADQAAEADAEAATAALAGGDAEAEAEAEAGAEAAAEPAVPVVPFTSDEMDAFIAQQRANGSIIAAIQRCKALMAPIANNKPVFLTVEQQMQQNKAKADSRRGGRGKKDSKDAKKDTRGGRRDGAKKDAPKQQQQQQGGASSGSGRRRGGRGRGNKDEGQRNQAPRDTRQGGRNEPSRGGRDQPPRGRDQQSRDRSSQGRRDQSPGRRGGRAESPNRGPRNDRDRDHRRRR